jgi:putative drug exporter of the RND superfamily
VPIVSFVPLLMFAVLFGLSMDYEVFLMSQIAEHHGMGESNHDSVVHGLAFSARVITAAALIMVAVFASFILNENPIIKQFGVGLPIAIALDATIIRILLVPATMRLLGNANWWFPRWLGKITPRLDLEGKAYFLRLERASAPGSADDGEPSR